MAALELEAKLAILDQAMKRLEGELQQDEHWRALHLPMPDADGEAALARKRRLLEALETNAVYRAWRDMRGVAELVRGQTPPAVTPPTPGPPAGNHPAPPAAAATPARAASDAFAAHYELPGDMADLVRSKLEDASQDLPPGAPSQQPQRRSKPGGLSQRLARAVSDGRAEEGRAQEVPVENLGSEATHSVPLAAEDLEFLISPARTTAPSPAAPAQKTSFLQRLAAEGQIPRPLRTDDSEEAEVTVVRRRKKTPHDVPGQTSPDVVDRSDAETSLYARVPKPLGS